MKNVFALLITMAMFLNWISFSYGITQEKEKDIRTLLILMGNDAIIENLADTMTTVLIKEIKNKMDISKRLEHDLSKVMYDTVIKYSPDFDKLLVPIYNKYYSHSEIKELIVFFKSPIGQKYASVLHPMMQDILPIGQKFSAKIFPILVKKMDEELTKHGIKG